MIADLTELNAYLAQTQAQRDEYIRCELAPVLSARMNDAALTEALVLGLARVQGIQQRIVRSRGGGVILTAKLRYRQGVRMLAGEHLTQEECAALEMARSIAADFLPLDGAERFNAMYNWICHNVCYVHTAPGQKGYERLVCASGALMDGQANCQGFADVLYLLCGLCGIEAEYRIGRGERRLHVWNAVCINGVWCNVDTSRGARYAAIPGFHAEAIANSATT